MNGHYMQNHRRTAGERGLPGIALNLALNLALALALALALTACEQDASFRDAPMDAPEWELGEEWRIGSSDEPDYALTSIGGVFPFEDGSVWVLQPQDRDVRRYDADGGFQGTVGGTGQGPGELMVMAGAGWWGAGRDTVWIADPVLRRVSLFGPDGAFARSFPIPNVEYEERYTVDRPSVVLSDGSALALASHRPGEEWDALPIVRFDPEGGDVRNEVARLDRTTSVQIRWEGTSVATTAHPLSDAPLVAYARQDHRVIIVDRTVRSEDPQIGVAALSLDGDTLWSRRFSYEPRPISRAEADSLVRPRIESFQRFVQMEGRLSEGDAERAYREAVRIPEHHPAIASVRVDVEGRIWLESSGDGEGPTRSWVLSPDGELIGGVALPPGVTIRGADGDWVWASGMDELDVPSLVRYRIVAPFAR